MENFFTMQDPNLTLKKAKALEDFFDAALSEDNSENPVDILFDEIEKASLNYGAEVVDTVGNAWINTSFSIEIIERIIQMYGGLKTKEDEKRLYEDLGLSEYGHLLFIKKTNISLGFTAIPHVNSKLFGGIYGRNMPNNDMRSELATIISKLDKGELAVELPLAYVATFPLEVLIDIYQRKIGDEEGIQKGILIMEKRHHKHELKHIIDALIGIKDKFGELSAELYSGIKPEEAIKYEISQQENRIKILTDVLKRLTKAQQETVTKWMQFANSNLETARTLDYRLFEAAISNGISSKTLSYIVPLTPPQQLSSTISYLSS